MPLPRRFPKRLKTRLRRAAGEHKLSAEAAPQRFGQSQNLTEKTVLSAIARSPKFPGHRRGALQTANY